MELRKASAFVCLAGLLWHSPDAHAQETVTTVCELASDSEAHHAKTVKVSGRIVSDRIERTIIVDSSCPDVGVSVLIGGKSSTKNPRVVELFEAVFGGTPGIYEKHITVTYRYFYAQRRSACEKFARRSGRGATRRQMTR